MRRSLSFALVLPLLFAFVAHAAWSGGLQVGEARPNLVHCVLMLSCLFVDGNTGAAIGLITGLLEGSFAGRYIGSFLVSRTLVGFLAGVLEERVFRDNLLFALFMVFSGSLLIEGCFFLFAPRPHVVAWAVRTLLSAVYNTLLALPLYYVLRPVLRSRTPD